MELVIALVLAVVFSGFATSGTQAHADDSNSVRDIQRVYLDQQQQMRDAQHEVDRMRAAMELANSAPQAYREAVIGPQGFIVKSSDKSVLSLIVRWAHQDGRQVVLNGRAIEEVSDYKGSYVDYPLVASTRVIADRFFLGAVKALAATYSGRTAVPLELNVTESRLEIISQRF